MRLHRVEGHVAALDLPGDPVGPVRVAREDVREEAVVRAIGQLDGVVVTVILLPLATDKLR